MYKGNIPFGIDGNHMVYPQDRYEWEYEGERYPSWSTIQTKFGKDALEQSERISIPPDWRPNAPFEAIMAISGMSRGRSAANFQLVDENGREYTMFMTDLLDLIRSHVITCGSTARLQWAFCKRGENYGVQLYKK